MDEDRNLLTKTRTQALAARVLKEPVAAEDSNLLTYLKGSWEESAMSSPVFLLHFRYATGTKHVYRNTHPFERELWGRSFTLCHNGVYHGAKYPGTFQPLGKPTPRRCSALCSIGCERTL